MFSFFQLFGININDIVTAEVYAAWRVEPNLVNMGDDDMVQNDLSDSEFLWIVGVVAAVFICIVFILAITVATYKQVISSMHPPPPPQSPPHNGKIKGALQFSGGG